MDGNVKYQNITEYNTDGNKIKLTSMGKDGKIKSVYEYLYDGEILSKEISYSYKTDGSFYKDCIKEYDVAGNIIKITFYNSSGEIDSINDYEYDENGTMIKNTYTGYSSWDGSTYTTVSEFDSYGNEIRYTSDGKIQSETKYEYNSFGDITKRVVYGYYEGGGDPEKDNIYSIETNEYDIYGNKTKEILDRYDSYNNSWSHVEGSWSYKYDKSGNITEYVEYGENGKIVWKYTSEYNAEGKRTKYTELSLDGSEHFYVYEYDKNGNETKRIHCNMDGTVISSQISEYQY